MAPNPIINKIVVQLTPDPKGARIIKEIYFTTLSRMPTDEELRIAEAHVKETWGDGGPRDLFWALINSPEFCYRH